MGKFLKNFGLGIVFMICSPVLIVLVLFAAVLGLFNFLVQGLKCVFRFFRGLSPFKELEIDHRVKQIKEQLDLSYAISEKEKEKESQQPQEKAVYIQQNYYQAPSPNPNAQLANQNPYQNLPSSQPSYTQIPIAPGPDIFQLPDIDDELPASKEEDKQ